MTCPTCEALRRRVAQLECQIALVDDEELVAQLRDRFGLRNQAARIALALYRAKGRVVSRNMLFAAIPPTAPGPRDLRDPHMLNVLIAYIRKALGPNSVLNIHGRGYLMSQSGLRRLDELLQQKEAA